MDYITEFRKIRKKSLENELEELEKVPRPPEPYKPTLKFQSKEMLEPNKEKFVKAVLLWAVEIILAIFFVFLFFKGSDSKYAVIAFLGTPISMILLVILGSKIKKNDAISAYLNVLKENERRTQYNNRHKKEIKEAKEIYEKEMTEYNKAMVEYESAMQEYNPKAGDRISAIKEELYSIREYERRHKQSEERKERFRERMEEKERMRPIEDAMARERAQREKEARAKKLDEERAAENAAKRCRMCKYFDGCAQKGNPDCKLFRHYSSWSG